ncbi:MAG: heme exporter protein CcmB [Thermoflexales bacterium]|nr:heme exporter protein CcmB [Thermoflexales bacterium]MCS7325530.1 heme exporter protein CcmB [Thermoflexales bacterium]MCX7940060.1 heme exporter protein CcmB [Thermoflexales bacterium]MDW8053972.1 heme exporter protein CcmB [Anaerolineae bacterium]MDW8293094.1 heme exporter protein CcmB [Anaerolineae bacterium]
MQTLESPSWARQVWALLWKDLVLEFRTRESITAMVAFAVMAMVMFNFALRLRVDAFRPLAPGILWVTLVFAGTLGLSRSFSNEQVNQCLDGLLLAPYDHSLVFIGKALVNFAFMLLTAALVIPLGAILLDERLAQPGVWLVTALGAMGYAGAGTLIAAMAANTRAREVFLPILLFPLALPLLVAAVIATAGFVDRAPLSEFGAWVGMIVAFIVLFWAAGTLLFEYLVES